MDGKLTCYNSSKTPHVKFSGSYINVSGAILSNNDLSLAGKITLYNVSQTPYIAFNGSSLSVSSTIVNTNTGITFNNIGSDPGIPYSQYYPTLQTASWATPGRLYYTNMYDSNSANQHIIKVLCIV